MRNRFHELTEFQDFVDALYDNLPKKLQSKDAALLEKLETLWNHIDKVDVGQAFIDFLQNQGEDRFLGKHFKDFEKASRDLGSHGYKFEQPLGL